MAHTRPMVQQRHYYANPAFSQQSEFYNGKPLSQINGGGVRRSPVGAQTQYFEKQDEDFDEQEFYEEMLVDDSGVIKEKKVVVVSSPGHDRYESIPPKPPKSRYEYIPMQEHGGRVYQTSPKRYALVEAPVEGGRPHRYEYIQDDYGKRYEYIQTSPQRPQPNPLATQKLHQLLTTPKRTPPVLSPRTQRRAPPSPASPQDPFLTPKKSKRVQQKLNYAIGAKVHHQEKRHTAIVAPMCSSPIQSVYSETTFSQKAESWGDFPHKKPTQLTLAIAAMMMMLCGGVTSGLCFYMVSIMGRLYFLDFGIVAGFTCLVLGLLGYRTRNCYWLPNRNYISGYILLSVFSLLMCAGLLVLLVVQPRPGTPLADMTSGAVCGISVLSIVLASVGVMTSYCCKYPPPDNRVQHSVPGFSL